MSKFGSSLNAAEATDKIGRAAYVVVETGGSDPTKLETVATIAPRGFNPEAEYVQAVSLIADALKGEPLSYCNLSFRSIDRCSEEALGVVQKLAKVLPVNVYDAPDWIVAKAQRIGIPLNGHKVTFVDPAVIDQWDLSERALNLVASRKIVAAAQEAYLSRNKEFSGGAGIDPSIEPSLGHPIFSQSGPSSPYLVAQEISFISDGTRLSKQFQESVADLVASTDGKLTLSLQGVKFLGENSIGAIIRAKRICEQSDRSFSLVDVHPNIAQKFRGLGLDRIMQWVQSAA